MYSNKSENFTWSQKQQIEKLNNRLKKGYSIDYSNYKSLYLIFEDEQTEERNEIMRFSDHISPNHTDQGSVNQNFTELMKSLKSYLKANKLLAKVEKQIKYNESELEKEMNPLTGKVLAYFLWVDSKFWAGRKEHKYISIDAINFGK